MNLRNFICCTAITAHVRRRPTLGKVPPRPPAPRHPLGPSHLRIGHLYGAQLANPRRDPDYWMAWHDFEVSHGNEETFREMLRVKRAIQAAFSTVNYNAAGPGGRGWRRSQRRRRWR